MIETKQDYLNCLEMDRIALNIDKKRSLSAKIGSLFTWNIWDYQRLLRKVEYYQNRKKNLFLNLQYQRLCWKFHRAQVKLGLMIWPNCFDSGLAIMHTGSIVVNELVRVGKNCRVYPGVVIGIKSSSANKAPKIGDNVYIGAGAKIFGDITIADGIAIGANSVVNKSFLEPNISIAGVPAKKVSEKGSKALTV